MLSAIVLAAGDSSRMGRTKALLKYKGATFLEVVCAGVKTAGAGETVVVLGSNRAEVLAAWKPKEEKVAYNETPELGQIVSVRAGLKMIRPEAEAVMICLVDQPTIEPVTYKLIADFWRSNKDSIVIPRCRRDRPQAKMKPSRSCKRGHPSVIPRKYFTLCLDGPADKGLHWVTHHPSAKVLDLVVADAGIIRDFDTPEDYKMLKASRPE